MLCWGGAVYALVVPAVTPTEVAAIGDALGTCLSFTSLASCITVLSSQPAFMFTAGCFPH